MREISWGRVFFHDINGNIIQYNQMGLYGKLVHPLVGVIVLVLLYFIFKAKIWKAVLLVKIPLKSFILFVLFILVGYISERLGILGRGGQVLEELSEFGAYMMMYCLSRDFFSRL